MSCQPLCLVPRPRRSFVENEPRSFSVHLTCETALRACGIFEHFPRFEFFLLPSIVHACPHAGIPLAVLGNDVANRSSVELRMELTLTPTLRVFVSGSSSAAHVGQLKRNYSVSEMNQSNYNEKPLVVEYDPQWVEEFEALAVVLAQAFGSLANNIYHVGSTAIPGMIAKPVLDIDLELAPGVDVATATKILASLGYEYEGDLGIPDRYAYRNASPAVPFSECRTVWMHHHLYVCPYHSAELARMLLFRDKLRNSAELRKEYMEIKQDVLQLAKGVRQVYVDEKARVGHSFFQRVLNSE
jgi:GrpB-like predicted nucleotidyltransferase (UPF0157 family)